MVRKLRLKITLFSVAVLLVLFLGTISVVYITSYRQTLRAEEDMLALYAAAYWENGNPAGREGEEMLPGGPPPGELALSVAPPSAGSFCSVETDGSGRVLSLNNAERGKISDGDLTAMAGRIAQTGKTDGAEGTWVYRVERRDGRVLTVLLDNTLLSGSSATLLGNTLRYGGLMVLLLVLAAWFASGWLTKPLEENERAQRQFVSDAGHELKTPAAVIAANAELLEREIGKNRWLENIKAENERTGALVGGLLELARAGERNESPEKVDLSTLFGETVLPFEGPAFERGHMLKVSSVPGLTVIGTRQQLSTLISVLMDNALQHSPEGSDIVMSLSAEGRSAVILAANDSPPMTPEACRRMFDRFYRADASRSGDGHYGMGLSIAKKIAEAHHGSIGASWKNGVLTFRVRIPLSRQDN